MENKKDFFASPPFNVLCQMGKRRKETGSVIPQVQAKHFASNASYFLQKIMLSPEVASLTGKMPQRMVAHEKSSKAHSDATMTLCQRAKASGRVNSPLIEQCQAERIYAKAVLERVVSTIKFLAERSLAFRGSDQVIGSPSNGNFLGILKLLSL